MKRPPSRRICHRQITGEPPREYLALECGHVLEQAPRRATRVRAYCGECAG
jgi:hypothetical protein